ncbi:MAG: hypothetical protein A2W62_04455 [Alphaproteobacteria bacterium RIFCSPLOWO2_02_42_7]|nr:MAG: hypothetical protein A2W62_04455 [Alphaproteobacteria bacterium RIFCSPLOWO2_02_42_7]
MVKKTIVLSFLTTTLLIRNTFAEQEDLTSSCVIKPTHSITKGSQTFKATNYLEITGAKELHEKGFKGKGTKAIIIDNCFLPHGEQPDNLTKSSISGSYNPKTMTAPGHGTNVLEIMKEIAPTATFKFITRYDPLGNKSSNSVCSALEEAARSEGDVVNLSFGLGLTDQKIYQALQNVVDSGKVIFVSFGNEYEKAPDQANLYSKKLIELAATPKMKGRLVPVASSEYCNGQERLSPFSNRVIGGSAKYALTAPGSDILTPMPGGEYEVRSGTSFASPIAAASYLLLKEPFPGRKPEEYTDLMRGSARQTSLNKSFLFNDQYGSGVLDLREAFVNGMKRKTAAVSQPSMVKKDEKKAIPQKLSSPKSLKSKIKEVADNWIVKPFQKAGTIIKNVIKSLTTRRLR